MIRPARSASLLALLALAGASPALAADGETDGSGESFWGPVPEPGPENTAAVEDEDAPAWEYLVDTPHFIVALPFSVAGNGVAEAGGLVDQSAVLQRLIHLFPIRIGPTEFSGGISAGGGDGFGANLSLDVPELGNHYSALKLRGAWTSSGKGKGTLGLKLAGGPRSRTELGAGYRSNNNARFYGFGPETDEGRESYYREEVSWTGISHRRSFGDSDFSWEGSVVYSGVGANGTSESDEPQLSSEFADEIVARSLGGRPFVGYRDRSDAVSVGLELAHDNTTWTGPPTSPWRERGRPERGGIRRAKVTWASETGDSEATYLTWRGEVQQFVPLWFSRRALAVRGFISQIENSDNDKPLPFQRLLTNDDPDLFRGYQDYRFRDLGIAAASAEYRWPIWVASDENGLGLDAYGFFDVGQVFEEVGDIDSDGLTKSYGGGLRFVGFGQFKGRLEFAASEEDFIIRFRADQIFQYAKGGLFNGRNPVPAR